MKFCMLKKTEHAIRSRKIQNNRIKFLILNIFNFMKGNINQVIKLEVFLQKLMNVDRAKMPPTPQISLR